jgi:hypothetical protein
MRRSAVTLALLMVVAALAPVGAAADPVAGGQVRLQLDKRFRTFLARDRVRLAPAEGAVGAGGALRFPLTGGEFDPVAGKGKLELGGAMVFRNARKQVPVRKIAFETSGSPFVAKVGGTQLKVATARPSSSRQGFGARLLARRLRLTPKVATRLNKKLRPPVPFVAGQVIGDLVAVERPLVTSLIPSGRMHLVLDSAFVEKLDRQFVSVNPIFPAEHSGADFTLPIGDRSTLAPDAAAGTVRSGGELEFLQLGRGQVFWRELWFDFGAKAVLAEPDLQPSPPFPGRLEQGPILELSGGTVASDPSALTIGLAGAVLSLSAPTAASFNQAFAEGNELFHAGERAASLTFAARAR